MEPWAWNLACDEHPLYTVKLKNAVQSICHETLRDNLKSLNWGEGLVLPQQFLQEAQQHPQPNTGKEQCS